MSFLPSAEKRPETSPSRGIRWSATAAALLLVVVLTAKPSLSWNPPQDQAAQNQAGEDQPKAIHGTVINSLTKNPVARALVSSTDSRFATLTDFEGRFEFILPREDEKEGGQTPSSNRPAFYSSIEQIRRNGGEQIWLKARKPGFLEENSWGGGMFPAFPGSDATIEITPEALIKGRVTLSTSDAANSILVQLFARTVVDGLPRWTPGTSARANSAGEFRFADLRPGSYKLMTQEWMDNDPATANPGGQLYGFPPVYYPAAVDFSTAASIELTVGETVEADLSLTRQAYYPVRIPVASELIGNGLRVTVQGQRGPGYTLGFNGSTHRIEGTLPNGTYGVEASSFGENAANGRTTLVVAGRPAETAPLALVRGTSIHIDVKENFNGSTWNGTSTVSDGRHSYTLQGPRAYVQISAESADEFDSTRSLSLRPPTGPNDTSFALDNVAPGRYWLQVHTGQGYVASATMGTTDLLHEPLIVDAGENPPIEVMLRDDGAELEGTISAIAKKASAASNGELFSPQAWVYCVPLPDSAGRFQQIIVNGEGMFQAQMLAPGSYRILAFSGEQQFIPYRDPEAMKAFENKGPVVNLTAGQKTTIEIPTLSDSE